ncbi:MAG: hypothetical protein H0X64_11005 [Gemmatimonadaceae bacterium]|nr:hypothetical protein [Gemmatimonadaceae bacterium]
MRRILLAGLVMAAACAGSGARGMPTRDPDVITAVELATQAGVTARQAIERLRPRFLRVRGPSTINAPDADRIVVYVDNSRMGGVEVLNQIRADDITEIRYMSAPDATSRYGTGHSAGAIVIMRK